MCFPTVAALPNSPFEVDPVELYRCCVRGHSELLVRKSGLLDIIEVFRSAGDPSGMKAAQDVVALAHGQTGKRQDAAASLAACRQLFAAFNTLVVE